MKFDYCSDLHFDFYAGVPNIQLPKFKKKMYSFLEMCGFGKSKADALIIAGDLGHYNQQDQALLLELKTVYKYIILVRGNHDMYLVSNSTQKKYLYNSMNRVLEMKRWCRENDIVYLDGEVISIEGINIAGVGMSWDKSYAEKLEGNYISDSSIREFFNNYMNDSMFIFGGSKNYRVPTAYGGNYLKSSFDPFGYFKEEYNKLNLIYDFDNIDIMVTHYPPLMPPDNKYEDDKGSTFYMFDGEKDILRISPKYWVFGHMHSDYNFTYEDVNFLCSPIGYPGEKPRTKCSTFEVIK